jgi:glycosyltransferase involved in cell wall biosynthesis
LPIAVLEAMSHGRAVIVSDIPENLEAIGDAALTFPVGDVATLRQRMRSLQENPPECAELGERARQRIAAHFDWDPIAMRTEAVYRQALGSARAHLVAPGRRDC